MTSPLRGRTGRGPGFGSASARRRGVRVALIALPAVFLTVFFLWPVANILDLGLRPEGHFEWSKITEVWGRPRYRHVLWFTFEQALLSTLLTVALALPGAWALARLRFWGRGAVWVAVTIPFVLPTIVVAAAFNGLFGPGGALGLFDVRRSFTAILLAHAFFNYAVVVRTVGGLWSQLDPGVEEAARTLGASRWRAFRSGRPPPSCSCSASPPSAWWWCWAG
jgi:thiamine transport system permease protein